MRPYNMPKYNRRLVMIIKALILTVSDYMTYLNDENGD